MKNSQKQNMVNNSTKGIFTPIYILGLFVGFILLSMIIMSYSDGFWTIKAMLYMDLLFILSIIIQIIVKIRGFGFFILILLGSIFLFGIYDSHLHEMANEEFYKNHPDGGGIIIYQ